MIVLPQFVGTGFQVLFHSPHGVLFTFPSQYFALSVTKEYLGLRGGPRLFHQVSTCLGVLWIPPCSLALRLRGFHPVLPVFPVPFCCAHESLPRSEPRYARAPVWALSCSLAATWEIEFFFLFLRLLRCFSSPGSPPCPMDSGMDTWSLSMWVSPFRDPRLSGYLLLPAAFRSLSRLSSALSAKASSLRPFLLDHLFMICRSRSSVRIALRTWPLGLSLVLVCCLFSFFRHLTMTASDVLSFTRLSSHRKASFTAPFLPCLIS